jgi:hypothetical protein
MADSPSIRQSIPNTYQFLTWFFMNTTSLVLWESAKKRLRNSALKDHIDIISHSAFQQLLLDTVTWITVLILTIYFVSRFFTPPVHLRHLPRVSILPLLKSYLWGEVEDIRIRRLILPFANQKGEGVVLVWALGRWMVHILDEKVFLAPRDQSYRC